MTEIKGFDEDLNRFRSVRFQWALRQFRLADECRRREEEQRQGTHMPQNFASFSEKVYRHVHQAIGGLVDLPDRIDYQVVREFTFDGIRIQVILFESLPGFKVPGTIYFPQRDDPGPGIFIASGHFGYAKSHNEYQYLARELARNRFTVVIIDMMGLGERKSWLKPDGTVYRSGSHEHNYMGVPCHLAGFNLARYIIHDARCGISLLQDLPSVDPERIGVTGHSGGGLMTTYLALFDGRISAVAPVCFLCDRYRHMGTTCGNDAESMTFGVMAQGINTADFLAGFVPKPVFAGGVESDIFPADGFMLEVERLKHMYEVAGKPGNFEYLLTQGRHSYNAVMREAAIRFFAKHLGTTGGVDGQGQQGTMDLHFRSEEEVPLLPHKELNVAPSGLIYRDEPQIPRANDINRQAFEKLDQPARPKGTLPEALGVLLAIDLAAITAIPLHTAQINESPLAGGEVRYLCINAESNLDLGGIVLAPETSSGEAWLYLMDEGANGIEARSGEALERMRRGDFVLFADVRGRGGVEAALINCIDRFWRGGTEHWFASQSVLMGTSVAAQRTHDAVRWMTFLQKSGFPLDRVHLHGQGQSGLSALFAAVLMGRSLSFEWEDSLPDWDDIIRSRDYDYSRFNESVAVFGIARHFTMGDLLESIGASLGN